MNTNKCEYAKLIEYRRNNLSEQIHTGIILHMNRNKIITQTGNDNGYKFYHRSCMKPLQIATLIDLEIDKKINLTDEEIAICSASHAGEMLHQEMVLSILKKTGYKEDDLLCPPLLPLSKKEQRRLIINQLPIRKIHNNCSGKHSAMLAICKEKGYKTENYKDYNHPLTNIILNKVCELCETSKDNVIISKDGCGLPVIATSLYELGKGYLNLFCNPKYKRIKQSFLNNPYLIGGDGRLDTEIIKASKGKLIAKVGAGGLCTVVNTEKEECLIVKIADSNMEARSICVTESIKQLKWPENIKDFSDHLDKIYKKEIVSQDNEILGEIVPCFSISRQ